MLKARKRCQRACDTCKRRKERCDGVRPCLLCSRRGTAELCRFTESANFTSSSTSVRRDSAAASLVTVSPQCCSIATSLATSDGGRAYFGDSSTLGCLDFVIKLVSQLDLGIQEPPPEVLETELSYTEPDNVEDVLVSVPVSEYFHAYHSFARGIFDLYSAEELEAARYASTADFTLRHDLLTAAAIGAQERGEPGDANAAARLFNIAHSINARATLRTPDLTLVRALLLATLYLLVVCKRNAALMQLGAATQAAYTIGLHRQGVVDSPMELRAWRCLRVLDVSSAAALGRPLMTSDHGLLPPPHGDPNLDIEKAVDLAGLHLCFIAQQVLRTSYEGHIPSIEFAQRVSGLLRRWSDSLPDGFVPAHTLTTVCEAKQQLYWNHMTAAYHWTIMLLTRPFLIDAVLVTMRGDHSTSSEASPYVDACVSSAFHCIKATAHLLSIPDLGKKLFLVVNTTLVSSLVLCLAILGDYRGPFPLEEGLQHGEAFLSHQAVHDPQAAQYLRSVQFLREACQIHRQRSTEAAMKRREMAVSAIFGQVQATPGSKASPAHEVDALPIPDPRIAASHDTLAADVYTDTPPFDSWTGVLGPDEVFSHILDLEPEAY